MNPDELRAQIVASAELKSLAIAGSDGDIARAMSKPSGGPQITIAAVIGALSAKSAANLAGNPNVPDARDKLISGDLVGFRLWVALFAKGGIISADEAGVIFAAIDAQVPAVTVTVDQVNKALRPHRPTGQAGQKHWKDEV